MAIIAALNNPLHADWKITTAVTSHSGRYVSTEYVKDGLRRCDGTPRSVIVADLNGRRQTIWSLDSQQYVVVRLHGGEKQAPASGPAYIIDRTTTDTGERRTMFGRTARHLITDERRYLEGGVHQQSRTDGWYIDADTLPRDKRGEGAAIFVLAAAARSAIKLNQHGPAPAGMAVLQRTTSANGNEMALEVTELAEGPMPRELFEPPPGFQRAISLPGDYPMPWFNRVRLQWEWFEDWISGIA